MVQIERKSGRKSYKSWEFTSSDDFDRFSEYCVEQTGGKKPEYSNQDIQSILNAIAAYFDEVFNELLNANKSASAFPRWLRNQMDGGKKLEHSSVLTMEDILFLNNELPIDWQSEWRLLFSTNIHGESFARVLGQIVNQGPTLLVIKDTNNHIFGGFAPASWSLNPKFVGDSSSFLFTLKPELHVFPASNFNENYQYLNQGQQTLPNGLGKTKINIFLKVISFFFQVWAVAWNISDYGLMQNLGKVLAMIPVRHSGNLKDFPKKRFV